MFYHNDLALDDCADSTHTPYEAAAKAIIKEHKTTTGSYYYEASIRVGYLELVITGGFIGNACSDSINTFLGSSIYGIPESLRTRTREADTIKVRTIPALFVTNNRLLRQYSKIGAA